MHNRLIAGILTVAGAATLLAAPALAEDEAAKAQKPELISLRF